MTMRVKVAILSALGLALAGCQKIGAAGSGGDAASWSFHKKVDQLTDNTQYEATRTLGLSDGIIAELTADCRGSEGAWLVNYHAVFFDGQNHPIEVDQAGMDNDHRLPLRISFAAGTDEQLKAEVPHSNEVVFFEDNDVQDVVSFGKRVDFYGQLLQYGMSKEDYVKIEVPLLTGGPAVIDLDKDDAELQKLVSFCIGNLQDNLKKYHDDHPPEPASDSASDAAVSAEDSSSAAESYSSADSATSTY
jgi:hypothetical protein